MTTTAYTVDEFIGDVREIFDDTQDPLAQASRVAEKMEVLLQTPGSRTVVRLGSRALSSAG